MELTIDRQKAFLMKKGFQFKPFQVPREGILLRDINSSPHLELIIFKRGQQRRALLLREMAYHHVAQGELAGEPYLIGFCPVCNSGMGLTPVVNGRVYHFGVAGMYNGLPLLADEETRSYWDFTRGEALSGTLVGSQLKTWPIALTTVKAALAKYPDLTVSLSTYRSPKKWLFQRIHSKKIYSKGFLPPFFRLTMSSKIDARLPKMTQGLGVVVSKRSKYYPMSAIPEAGLVDEWNGRPLLIKRGEIDRIPYAVWQENGQLPMQQLSRWYGFSFTYPRCAIFRS